MRAWSISAFFPEVKPAHEAMQSCTVQANRISTAAQRGLDEVLSRDAIKHRHITIVKLSIISAGKEKPAA